MDTRPEAGSARRSSTYREIHRLMLALPIVLLAIVLVVGLRQQSESVLDRTDPRIWPYLHH